MITHYVVGMNERVLFVVCRDFDDGEEVTHKYRYTLLCYRLHPQGGMDAQGARHDLYPCFKKEK